MLVELAKLNEPSTEKWKYSNKVEQEIAYLITKFKPGKVEMAIEGICHPHYDFTIDGLKYEVKCSKHYNPLIEICRPDNTKSGLSITEADYYVLITPGRTTGLNPFFKIRIFTRAEIFNAVIFNSIEKVIYKTSSNHMGSKNVRIDIRKTFHEWICDLALIYNNQGKIIGFDTNKILAFGPKRSIPEE